MGWVSFWDLWETYANVSQKMFPNLNLRNLNLNDDRCESQCPRSATDLPRTMLIYSQLNHDANIDSISNWPPTCAPNVPQLISYVLIRLTATPGVMTMIHDPRPWPSGGLLWWLGDICLPLPSRVSRWPTGCDRLSLVPHELSAVTLKADPKPIKLENVVSLDVWVDLLFNCVPTTTDVSKTIDFRAKE